MVASRAVPLRPPRHRVDRRAVPWWTLTAVGTVAPPLIALIVLAITIPPARSWLVVAAIVVGVIGMAYVVVMPAWRYRVHRWETTDDAVYSRRGWFFQEWRIAPMSRIQTVDTKRGPLQQLFGLSSVIVTTASAAGAITIDGLDRELAEEVVEKLTEVTQATRGDAT